MNELIYLAGPYSIDPARMFKEHMRYAAEIFRKGHKVFSPILHCHPLAEAHSLPGDANFWQQYNERMLDCCTTVWIIDIPEWHQSTGVLHELNRAVMLRKPVLAVKLTDEGLFTYPITAE